MFCQHVVQSMTVHSDDATSMQAVLGTAAFCNTLVQDSANSTGSLAFMICSGHIVCKAVKA